MNSEELDLCIAVIAFTQLAPELFKTYLEFHGHKDTAQDVENRLELLRLKLGSEYNAINADDPR